MDPDSAAATTLAWEFLIGNWIVMAQTTLVVYEHICTIDQEVSLIWRRKWTGVTVLFVVNRYLLLLMTILLVVPPTPPEWCIVNQHLLDAIILIQIAVFAIFSALRVYALWDRNTFLFALILLPNLVPLAINFHDYVVDTPEWLGAPFYECTTNDPTPPVIDARRKFSAGRITYLWTLTDTIKVTRASRISTIVADALVVGLTWVKTFQSVRQAMKLKINVSMAWFLLRDGTAYFCVLLALNIVVIVTWISGVVQSEVASLVPVMTPILVSRFMLNLRRVGQDASLSGDTAHDARFSTLAFVGRESRITGNLGEDLRHFGSDVQDDVETAGDSVEDGDTVGMQAEEGHTPHQHEHGDKQCQTGAPSQPL